METALTALYVVASHVSNAVDVTDLTDAALDVVLAVRSGEDFVDCAHLTPAERLAVNAALGFNSARDVSCAVGPSKDAERGPRTVHRDIEGIILDRQDEEQNGE